MRLTHISAAAALAAFALAGCSGAPAEFEAPTAPEPEPAATTPAGPDAPATDAEPGVPLELSEPDANGIVTATVDPGALSDLFFAFNDALPDDPFFQIHTNDPELFVGIELYTMYGDGWTGQTGTFAVDCNANGICVYFDPDGTGPTNGLGPALGGEIVIDELGEGYDVTLTGVTFPGYTLADLTLTS